GEKQIFKNRYIIPVIIFLAGATISIFTSPAVRDAAGIWKAYFIEPILLMIVLINSFKEKKDYRLILYALGITTIGFGLLGLFQKITGWGIYEPIWQPADARRITLTFTSPNAVGLYLGPIIVLYASWFFYQYKDWPKSLFKLAVLILGIVTVLLAVSRGAMLGVIAGLVVVLFFNWSKKGTTLIIAALLSSLFLIKSTAVKLWSFLTFQFPSGELRLYLWKGAKALLLDNWLFGAGLGGFGQLFENYRPENYTEILIYPHNIFLNFWTETGLLGLLGFIAIIFTFFTIAFTINKRQPIDLENKLINIGLLGAMISILVHGLVDVPYFKNDLAVLFWILIALNIIIFNQKINNTGTKQLKN
ncbi:MAG TPA: O-antigen ligase family protein, partial [Patescibacteria group bacterium]